VAGQTIIIPPVPPSQGYRVPRIQIPSIPSITFPSFDFSGLGFGVQGYLSLFWGADAHPDTNLYRVDWVKDNTTSYGSSFTFPLGGTDYTQISFAKTGFYILSCGVSWFGTAAVHGIIMNMGININAFATDVESYAPGLAPLNISAPNFCTMFRVLDTSNPNFASVRIDATHLNSTIGDGDLHIMHLG
jgi:hypothetical protein